MLLRNLRKIYATVEIHLKTSDISVVIPCPYHGVTGCTGEYVRSVGISDISSEVEPYLIFLLVLPRFPFRVKFLHGQSVQRIALAWELGGEGEQSDVVFQLGLLSIPTKEG